MDTEKRNITRADLEKLADLLRNGTPEWLIILATLRQGESLGNNQLAAMLDKEMGGTSLTHPANLSRARKKLVQKGIMKSYRTFGTIYEMTPNTAEQMKRIVSAALSIQKEIDERNIAEAEKTKKQTGQVL